MNQPPQIVTTFVTDEPLPTMTALVMAVTFNYDDGVPLPRLASASASFSLRPQRGILPPPLSPPAWPQTINLNLVGPTNFDWVAGEPPGLQTVRGYVELKTLSVPESGGVWLDAHYGSAPLSHFEGIAVTFGWYLNLDPRVVFGPPPGGWR